VKINTILQTKNSAYKSIRYLAQLVEKHISHFEMIMKSKFQILTKQDMEVS